MRCRSFVRALLALVHAWSFAGCVTTSGNTDEELRAWRERQEAFKKALAVEQRSLRQSVHEARLTNPFVWQIEHDGKISWMLGTIHLGVSAGALPMVVRNVYEDARVTIMEADLDQGKEDIKHLVSNKPKASESLETLIGPEAWKVLRTDLTPVPPDVWRGMSPSAAKAVYLETRSILAVPAGDCMDCEIQSDARRAGRKLAFLETVAEVMPTLSMMKESEPVTAAEFAAFLRGHPDDDVKAYVKALYEAGLAYKQGDLPKLEKILPLGATYDALIAKRNRAWLPKIEAETGQGGAFVVVGVGHMTGSDSLLKLLEDKGYKVKRWGS